MGKATPLPKAETEGYVRRLLENQDNIAFFFVPKFGKAAAESVAGLLREHIAMAGELIDALNTDDTKLQAEKKAAWYDNAARVGAALYDLQRGGAPYLSKAQWMGEMKMHLDLLTTLVAAYLDEKFDEALKATDPYVSHIRHLAVAVAKLVSNSSGPIVWPFGGIGLGYAYRPAQPVTPYSPFELATGPPGPPYRYRTQIRYLS
jgi:hypothetical protein